MSPESIVEYLVSRGLVVTRDIVEGDLAVEEAAGRNANFRVVSGTGSNYFVKQARDASSAVLLGNEAAFLDCVRREERWAFLKRWLPGQRSFDEERGMLVMHLLPSMHDVFDLDVDDESLGLPPIAVLIGQALAACHQVPLDPVVDLPFLTRDAPWALSVHRPVPNAFVELWSAQIRVLRAVQERAETGAILDRVAREWTATSLVHGDLKFQNVLVETAAGSRDPLGLAIVDWETAMVGDPAWDIGSVLQSYLWYGVFLVSMDDAIDASSAPLAFANRLPAYQREMRLFWNSYVGSLSLSASEAENTIRRAVSYAGVRLFQTAYELAQGEEEPGRLTSGALQLGLNVLHNPDDARLHLIGIAPRAGF